MSAPLPAPAQAIQSALLADAEALVAAEGGAISSRQIRALAGAVSRRLAEIEAQLDDGFAGRGR